MIGKPFELAEYYDTKINDESIVEMEQILRQKMIDTQNQLIELLDKKKENKKGK